MAQVAPGVHQINMPMANRPAQQVNAFLLEDRNGFTLVDCGWDTPESLTTLEGALQDLGGELRDLRTLVLTHYHIDHYGLAATLARLVKPRLLIHRLDWHHLRTRLADTAAATADTVAWMEANGIFTAGWGERERRTLETLRCYRLAPADIEMEEGDAVEAGGRDWRVVWTPGHTYGHVCLYDPRDRLLISGDHVLENITPHVSLGHPAAPNLLGLHLEALRKVAALDVALVLPGHGTPFAGLAGRVEELLAHHAQREADVVAVLSQGPATGAEVARAIPWSRRGLTFQQLPMLQQWVAVAQALAHMEKLEIEGRVRRQPSNGLVRFALG